MSDDKTNNDSGKVDPVAVGTAKSGSEKTESTKAKVEKSESGHIETRCPHR